MKKGKRDSVPKIVVIGGGTGVFTVLSGLKKYPADLTAVVSMADDGGSTGVLSEEFGILPPGDIRRALVALAHADHRILSELFNYRFDTGGLKGHAFGNIMLTALERVTGSFENAVDEAGRLLGISGAVVPVTLDRVRLCAKLEDGTVIRGETNIDIPKHNGALRIARVWLAPAGRLNTRAASALAEANLIVIGPGDLYTSLVPNLLIKGVTSLIRRSRAMKVLVANITTKWGETHGFTAADFVRTIEQYLGARVLDYVIVNTSRPSPERMRRYRNEHAEMVLPGLLSASPTPVFGDFVRHRGFVRHDPDALAAALMKLVTGN